MKRILSILSIAAMFAFASCGGGEEATGEAAAAAEPAVEETAVEETAAEVVEEIAEEGTDHVCSAKCEDAGECVTACGEKGHTCSDACHADAGESEEAEGEATEG